MNADLTRHPTYISCIEREQRLLRLERQARRWLSDLRAMRALAAARDEGYRLQITALRAEVDRCRADGDELRRQLQGALERANGCVCQR